ncbi:MAG: DUF2254 domain-containing protein [Acetobacteraceae bacterium]
MPLWCIPMIYVLTSVVAGFTLPRLEQAYLPAYAHEVAVGSALAFFSSVSSGMMALTGIVFAIAFVMVQFIAVAYSPRIAVRFANQPRLFHSLGIFFATFTYSLAAVAWTDRGGSGTVPFFSTVLVIILLVVSAMAFVGLIQGMKDLQIHNVLQNVGRQGRAVIRTLFERIPEGGATPPESAIEDRHLPHSVQRLIYSGEPRVITRFDAARLVRVAEATDAVLVLECAVGDTLVEDALVLTVHGASAPLSRRTLMKSVHLGTVRTFEQDPKYAIRLLVDIAIRALSPAINDPTTAVQALDQIEDLLRRLGHRKLDAGRVFDAAGSLRLIIPMPTWDDYLALAFDEIRQFGATSVQVARRLRAALSDLAGSVATEERRAAVGRYLDHLNSAVGRSAFDDYDQATALGEDRQGLGLSRKRAQPPVTPGPAKPARTVRTAL